MLHPYPHSITPTLLAIAVLVGSAACAGGTSSNPPAPPIASPPAATRVPVQAAAVAVPTTPPVALDDTVRRPRLAPVPQVGPAQINSRGQGFQASGQRDSAIAYYGHALQLQDTVRARQMAELLSSSPLLQPTRSLPEEAAFIRDVRALVRATPAGEAAASEIRSAEEAMAWLDALMAHRRARIEVRHTPSLRVEYRSWRHRSDPNVLWIPLQSDTVVTDRATAYQFRYRIPGTTRDTVVDIPCADGCRVPHR